MTRFRKSMDERDQGFTLIELLVVIIIVGVLSAIAIPVFLNQRKKAIDASLKSDGKSLANAAEAYAVDSPNDNDFITPSLTANANLAAQGFKRTPNGNDLGIYGGPAGGYCILLRNVNGSGGVTGYTFYDSSNGGLQSGYFDSWGLPSTGGPRRGCGVPGWAGSRTTITG